MRVKHLVPEGRSEEAAWFSAGSADRPDRPPWGRAPSQHPTCCPGLGAIPLLARNEGDHAHIVLGRLLPSLQESLTCPVPSLDSWAFGFHPPWPTSYQVHRAPAYPDENLRQAVMQTVRSISGGTWTNAPYYICHVLF